jgi:MFS family permease
MDLGLERRAWALLYLCLGVVEGGTAAVMVRALFADDVPTVAVDLVLALVSAAPAWANLASLAYARKAQGRPKVRILRPLLIAMSVCVAALALVPSDGIGLLLFFLLYGATRVLWAGVETVRAVLWSANYPRRLRARIAGRIMIYGSLSLAASGLALGWLLDRQGEWFRLAILAAAGCGLGGSALFAKMRVRGEAGLLAAERASLESGARFGLSGMRDLLAQDPVYRRYMFSMSLFGAGNLVLTPLVVISLDEVLGLPKLWQVAVTTAAPVLVIPLAVPGWAAFLDRVHVVAYRAVHGWILVTAATLLVAAILLPATWLLLPGAILMGVSMAAGSLGWTLGHNDFAPRGQETRYMALHVTLTGIRGLLAPPLGVAAFHLLERFAPGRGAWSLLLPLGLVILGAYEFWRMKRDFPALNRR